MSEIELSGNKACKKLNLVAGASIAALLLIGSSFYIGSNYDKK